MGLLLFFLGKCVARAGLRVTEFGYRLCLRSVKCQNVPRFSTPEIKDEETKSESPVFFPELRPTQQYAPTPRELQAAAIVAHYGVTLVLNQGYIMAIGHHKEGQC